MSVVSCTGQRHYKVAFYGFRSVQNAEGAQVYTLIEQTVSGLVDNRHTKSIQIPKESIQIQTERKQENEDEQERHVNVVKREE